MQFSTIFTIATAALSGLAAAAPATNTLDRRTGGDQCQPRLNKEWTGGNISSCKAGVKEASTYTAVSGAGCGISFNADTALVAASYFDIEKHPNQSNPDCGKYLKLKNGADTSVEIEVRIVDTCPTCSGVGSTITGQYANHNGATIDLSGPAFSKLFFGQTTGVFDVVYGSPYSK